MKILDIKIQKAFEQYRREEVYSRIQPDKLVLILWHGKFEAKYILNNLIRGPVESFVTKICFAASKKLIDEICKCDHKNASYFDLAMNDRKKAVMTTISLWHYSDVPSLIYFDGKPFSKKEHLIESVSRYCFDEGLTADDTYCSFMDDLNMFLNKITFLFGDDQ